MLVLSLWQATSGRGLTVASYDGT